MTRAPATSALLRRLLSLSETNLAKLANTGALALFPTILSSQARSLITTINATPSLPNHVAPQAGDTRALALVLARLSARDPSLARALLPTDAALLDLAFVAAPCAFGAAKDIYERLVDPRTAARMLNALSAALQAIGTEDESTRNAETHIASIRLLARFLAAQLSVLPESALRDQGALIKTVFSALSRTYNAALPALAKQLGGLRLTFADVHDSGVWWEEHWLAARTDLLDAAWVFLQSQIASGRGLSDLLRELLAPQANNGDHALNAIAPRPAAGHSLALVTAPLFVDLATVHDFTKRVRDRARGDEDVRAAVDKLDILVVRNGGAEGRFPGAGWAALRIYVSKASAAARERPSKASGKGKGRALDNGYEVPEDMVDQVHAILPHISVVSLRIVLARQQFRDRGLEETIQLLLEAEEKGGLEDEASEDAEPVAASVVPQPAEIYEPPAPVLSARRNVFNDSLDASRMRWGKARDASTTQLDAALKASILAAAEAPSSDEEEWDPLEDGNAHGMSVGFEEELDADVANDANREDGEPEGLHRRMGIASLTGARANARDFVRHVGDAGSESEEDEAERSQGAGRGASSTPAALHAGAGAEAERAAERALVKAYADEGPGLFAREAGARKNAKRKELRELTGWDDHSIESWGVMFERNVSLQGEMRRSWYSVADSKAAFLDRTSRGKTNYYRQRGTSLPRTPICPVLPQHTTTQRAHCQQTLAPIADEVGVSVVNRVAVLANVVVEAGEVDMSKAQAQAEDARRRNVEETKRARGDLIRRLPGAEPGLARYKSSERMQASLPTRSLLLPPRPFFILQSTL